MTKINKCGCGVELIPRAEGIHDAYYHPYNPNCIDSNRFIGIFGVYPDLLDKWNTAHPDTSDKDKTIAELTRANAVLEMALFLCIIDNFKIGGQKPQQTFDYYVARGSEEYSKRAKAEQEVING